MEKKPPLIIAQTDATLQGRVVKGGLKPESATLEQCNNALVYLASESLGGKHDITIRDLGEGMYGYSSRGTNDTVKFVHKFMDTTASISKEHPTSLPLSCFARALNAMAAELDEAKPVPTGQPSRMDALSSYQRALTSTSRHMQ